MTDLLAFLTLRLGEDTAEAASHAGPPSLRTRQRREVEAKRQLITFALDHGAGIDNEYGDGHTAEEIAAGRCHDHGADAAARGLHIVAAVYSDHPDYQESWKS